MQTKVLPLSLKASAWLLSGLGKPFPGLTARLFLRMYSTPPKRKIRDSQQAVKQKAAVSSIQLTSYPFNPAPIDIVAYRWGSPGKKVLIVHGWGDTCLSFGALIEQLVAAGYEVVAYDAPAHGASAGKRTNLIQWLHVLAQVMRLEKEVYAIVAHSVGALTAALTLAREEQMSVARLVLAAPSLSAPAFFQETFDLFGIRNKVLSKAYGLIRTNLKEDLSALDLHRYIGRIHADRILLVYDEQDQLIKYADIESYLAAYPSIQGCRIKGDGHFRILKTPKVIDQVLTYLS